MYVINVYVHVWSIVEFVYHINANVRIVDIAFYNHLNIHNNTATNYVSEVCGLVAISLRCSCVEISRDQIYSNIINMIYKYYIIKHVI